MASSIFERYGGFGAVSRIVITFYDRLLDDDDVGPYFDGVDMQNLIDHQTKFVATLLGGPASYSDEHLAKVHAKHHISIKDFHRTATILADVLDEFGMASEDIEMVMASIHRRAPAVVNDGGNDG